MAELSDVSQPVARVAMLVLHDMSWDRRVDREASALAAAGYDVDVFCFKNQGLPDTEQRNGYTIRRAVPWHTAPWRHPLRKLSMSRRRRSAFIEVVSAHAPDVVHCHDLPALQYGTVVGSRTGAKVVFDDHELFPDSLSQRSSTFVVAYWRVVERRHVARADRVITVSPGIAEILHRRYGVEASVVLNVPERVHPPCSGSRLRDTLGLPAGTPIVLYQGLLLKRGRALEDLVEAIARVPGAALVVQGTGEGEHDMRERAVALGVDDRTFFMGWVPTDELYEYTCGATVGTVFLDGVEKSHQHSLPNRLFLYLMAGVAPVVTDLPDMAAFVRETGIGVTAAPRDPDSMATAIRWMLEHPSERETMIARGRELAETRYNWPTESRRLLSVYGELGVSGGEREGAGPV